MRTRARGKMQNRGEVQNVSGVQDILKIYYVCIEIETVQQKSVVGTLKSKLHVMLAVLRIRERSGFNSNVSARMSVVEMERRSTVAP